MTGTTYLSRSNSTPRDLLNVTTDHDRQEQAAHRRYRQITHSSWVRFRWGPSIMTQAPEFQLACDFVVKFSPSVCVAVVAYLTGDVAARSFAYHVHGTADSDKSCCYPWFVCHEGSATKEISYTVGRNPIWNPEIQQNPEIYSEIQKSNLKSRNPLWNPEIHFEIRKSNLITLRVYPYTLN